MKIEDEMGNPCSMIYWTPLIRKNPQNVRFSKLINIFMSSRIFLKYKRLLQLSPRKMVRDLYLFEIHKHLGFMVNITFSFF